MKTVFNYIKNLFAFRIEQEEDEDGTVRNYYIIGLAHFILVPVLIYLAFFA